MKNILGEEYERTPISLEPTQGKPTAWILRGKMMLGLVSTNGWTGKSSFCEWDVGEPIITFFSSNHSISIKEIERIISEFKKHLKEMAL